MPQSKRLDQKKNLNKKWIEVACVSGVIQSFLYPVEIEESNIVAQNTKSYSKCKTRDVELRTTQLDYSII
jgi:hypothetical protein